MPISYIGHNYVGHNYIEAGVRATFEAELTEAGLRLEQVSSRQCLEVSLAVPLLGL